MDTPELSIRELGALFDQSPVATIFHDVDLRTRRANVAFRELTGLSEEAHIGQRPSQSEGASRIVDTELIERTLCGQVISTGVPVVNMHLEQSLPGQRRVFAWTAYRVTDNGRVLGAVSTLIDITGAQQDATDLVHANSRLELLRRAGSEIGTTLDVHRTAAELAALAVPELADRATVDLLDPVLRDEDPASADPGQLRLRRVAVRDAATAATVTFGVGDLITMGASRSPAVALSRGEALLARSRDEMRQSGLEAGHVQALLDRGVHTFVGVPLTARGVTLGVAVLCRAETPEPYDEADVRLVSDLASRAAVHIDNARLYTREHEAAATLQHSLLPRDIRQVPGLEIAYRYQPASRGREAGGDWFDVIPLDDGQVALVVGDVTGHGIQASAIMGQLRTTTTALARLGCPPDQIIGQLSGVVAAQGEEAGATCVHVVYDPRTRRCRLISAGHPPPVLRHPDRATELIDLPAGLLLGAGPGDYQAVDRRLPPGSILALYTDGLIEQPGQDLAVGMSRLARALADSPAESLDELCDSVLASLAPRQRDDVALLLARTTTFLCLTAYLLGGHGVRHRDAALAPGTAGRLGGDGRGVAQQDGAHRVVRGGAAQRARGDHGAFHAGDHGVSEHARRGAVHAEGDEVKGQPVGHLGESAAAGLAKLGRLLRRALGHQRRDAAAPAVVTGHHALAAEVHVPLDELGRGAGLPGGAVDDLDLLVGVRLGCLHPQLRLAAREVEVHRAARRATEREHVREGGRAVAALPDELPGRLHHLPLGV
jgi:PAS domain S-box-containing protein